MTHHTRFPKSLPWMILGGAICLGLVMLGVQIISLFATVEEFRFPIRTVLLIIFWLFVCVTVIGIYSHLTNPFTSGNIFHFPYRTFFEKNVFVFIKESEVRGSRLRIFKALGVIKSVFHILAYNIRAENLVGILREDTIRHDIYEERFNPSASPYLITGGHFLVLYPRNMGVFYRDLLNPDILPSVGEGQNRFRMYVQTACFTRDAFYSVKTLSTTIIPVAREMVACVNFYYYPSDSLYGLLYAFCEIESYMAKNQTIDFSLYIDDYKKSHHKLQFLLDTYIRTVYDPETGLIKKMKRLSSARDGVVRKSSFYDNVILWKTLQLASKLGLDHSVDIDNLKALIIKTFWSDEAGYFRDDLSKHVANIPNYSSDWLVAVFSGFLSFDDRVECSLIEKSVKSMIAMKIDEPLPLRYSPDTQKSKNVSVVRLAAHDYATTGIWSFWGMEYLRTLYILGNIVNDPSYAERADRFLELYRNKIQEYCGFPEVYNPDGNLMDTLLYRSVVRTSWIVGYDAVLALRESLYGKNK